HNGFEVVVILEQGDHQLIGGTRIRHSAGAGKDSVSLCSIRHHSRTFHQCVMREPVCSTVQTLERRPLPQSPSVVDDANSNCSAASLRSSSRCQALLRAWRTKLAAIIWCMAKIMLAAAQTALSI